MTLLDYLFATPVPLPWLLGDILIVILSLWTLAFLMRRSHHPQLVLFEAAGFVFLYAGIFENFAVVQSWYVYGRAVLMLGDVPLSVPLIEMAVFLLSLHLLEHTSLPRWTIPPIAGLLGMLEDFSIDPVAVRQIFETRGHETGRWTWLISPDQAQFYHIPVFNYGGWALIFGFAAIWYLAARWWFARSGEAGWVGVLYPFLAGFLALATLVSPLSGVLLFLRPVYDMGDMSEWVMFALFLALPVLLLLIYRRHWWGTGPGLTAAFPVLAVPALTHLYDLSACLSGGYTEVLWLVVLAGVVHVALLAMLLRSDGF